MHAEALRNQMWKKKRLAYDAVKQFHQIIKFHIDLHYVLIHPRQYPQHEWLLTPFLLTREEVESIVQEWKKEWRAPIIDDQVVDEDLDQDNPSS